MTGIKQPLLEGAQGFFDPVKVRQLLRGRRLLAVSDNSTFIDDERGPRADRSQAIQVRQKCAVSFRRFFVEVARQCDADLPPMLPANGLSTLTPITSAFKAPNWDRPAVTSHISVVHTPVNASGKNNKTMFFLPRFLLSATSAKPEAFLDLRVKSGALEPAAIAIVIIKGLRFVPFQMTSFVYSYLGLGCQTTIELSSARTSWAWSFGLTLVQIFLIRPFG